MFVSTAAPDAADLQPAVTGSYRHVQSLADDTTSLIPSNAPDILVPLECHIDTASISLVDRHDLVFLDESIVWLSPGRNALKNFLADLGCEAPGVPCVSRPFFAFVLTKMEI